MHRRARLLALALIAGCGSPEGCSSPEGPTPDGIPGVKPGGPTELPAHLAHIEIPPAPLLTPDEALAAFRVAPGFRVELVAAEPLVEDPVAITWDERGRMFAVEMRGYMPNIDGTGEDEPVGRVVMLTDADADGAMDESRAVLDGLVLPRAVTVADGGLLIGAPPDLFYCRDTTGDGACDERRRVGEYGQPRANVEHVDNGLLPGLDNWIYNAKSKWRHRLRNGEIEREETAFRGQWGIAQDDVGRLYTNTNSQLVAADLFPAEYLGRHPFTGFETGALLGITEDLAPDTSVHTIRVNPGVTRGYLDGSLRDDGRLAAATSISGLAVQRGDQYGPDYVGDLFIPEPAGNVVLHLRVQESGFQLATEHVLYDDPDWGQREFLASTDERFRPVNASVGPDGAIYVIDMYRGIIQHGIFITDYLRKQIEERGLDKPIGMGRIWRLVREDRPISHEAPALDQATAEQWVATLSHPNGWWRDTAQRLLVESGAPGVHARLRELSRHSALGRVHALWTLHGVGELDVATLDAALSDADPRVRVTGLRVASALVDALPADALTERLAALRADADRSVRLHLMFALGELSGHAGARTEMLELLQAENHEPHFAQALLSGLAGHERATIEQAEAAPAELLTSLAHAAFVRLHWEQRTRDAGPGELTVLLDFIAQQTDAARRTALLEGVARAGNVGGFEPAQLAGPHPLLDDAVEIARVVTWPGDDRELAGDRLTPEQQARFERGAELYSHCASCHGQNGRGLAGLAPPLIGSSLALDSDGWLIRIALQGLAGPLESNGQHWDAVMPGHAANPELDDAGLAALLTYVRRAWGHTGAPVEPETVAAVRAETAERQRPWSVEELHATPVDHRLDRVTGRYKMGLMPLSIRVARSADVLTMSATGMGSGQLEPGEDGWYTSDAQPGTEMSFEEDDSGRVTHLFIRLETGQEVRFKKVE